MLIMVISLLFSIIIGNGLHAMGSEEVETTERTHRDLPSDFNLDSLYNNTSDSQDTSSREASLQQVTGQIKTLTDIQGLARKMYNPQQTRSKDRTNFSGPIKIPNDIEIDSEVFKLYAQKESLIPESGPGFFRRTFCCRSKGQSQFEDASPSLRGKWAKKMLMVYSQPNSQTEASTKSDDYDVLFAEGGALISGKGSESDDNEVRKEESLKQKLIRLRWENKTLKEKAELDKELSKFFEKQEESEANSDWWKEKGAESIIAVGVFLSGVYGICP